MIFILFIATYNANAGERFEFYNGARSLGMGGVSSAVVNDETALLSNPAGLGKLRDYFVTVADPELDLGADTQSMVGADITAFLDPQKTLTDAKTKPGKHFHERMQLFPSFVVTNFGIGMYARYSADAETNAAATTYEYNYRNDFAAVFGFNFRMFDGRIKLGVNARAINRVESNRTDIPVATTGMKFDTVIAGSTVAREGFGIGSDVGLIFTAPWVALPTLSLVYHDVGNTRYDVNNGMFLTTTNRPLSTPATLDAAIAFFPIINNKTRYVFSVEMVDVMDAVEPITSEASDQVMRRIHGGMEINFSDVFFLRAGMNQGYWTAGMEIAVLNTQLQVATYGEEISDVIASGSTATYTTKEDRRYVAKFSYRF